MMLSAAPQWLREADIHILSTGAEVGEYAEKLARAGYRIHHIPFAKKLTFFIAVARLLQPEHYDIIHLHTERASPFFALTVRMSVGYSTFVLRTVHHIFRFNGLLRWRKFLERQFMRHFLRVFIVSNSPSGKKNELRRYRVKNPLFPNWYDSDHYLPPTEAQRMDARTKLGFLEETCIFLSLGGNWSYKNYGMIVDALTQIPKNVSVMYVQVGVQGEGLPLESLALQLGVSNRLRCEGVVDDPLVYLHAADVYIMPSSEEGFGVAAVEAMAAGLPALLSNVEALCDFRETVEGIQYVQPNPDSIAAGMLRMAELPAEKRRMLGRKQAEDVQNKYGLEVGPVKYLEAYRAGNKAFMVSYDHKVT